MIYLDTNFFFLCHFDQTEKGEKAGKLLAEIVKGRQAITSSLTLDEVMWVIIKNKRSAELRSVVEEIYATSNLTVKEVGSGIPLAALGIMEEHGLKPRDAFHAAVMKNFGVNEIVSDDSDFDKVKWIKRIKL